MYIMIYIYIHTDTLFVTTIPIGARLARRRRQELASREFLLILKPAIHDARFPAGLLAF